MYTHTYTSIHNLLLHYSIVQYTDRGYPSVHEVADCLPQDIELY